MDYEHSNEGQHKVEANIVKAVVGVPRVDDAILIKVPVEQVSLQQTSYSASN